MIVKRIICDWCRFEVDVTDDTMPTGWHRNVEGTDHLCGPCNLARDTAVDNIARQRRGMHRDTPKAEST